MPSLRALRSLPVEDRLAEVRHAYEVKHKAGKRKVSKGLPRYLRNNADDLVHRELPYPNGGPPVQNVDDEVSAYVKHRILRNRHGQMAGKAIRNARYKTKNPEAKEKWAKIAAERWAKGEESAAAVREMQYREPRVFPRTIRKALPLKGLLAAGGVVGGGGYGMQVKRAHDARNTADEFGDRDAERFTAAARDYQRSGAGVADKPLKHVLNSEQRKFREKHPKSQMLRGPVRRWEDKYTEAAAIRDAKPESNRWVHPVKSRRYDDKRTLSRLVEHGKPSPRVFRAMTLNEPPGERTQLRELTPWTPSKREVAEYAASGEKYAKHPVMQRLRGQKGLDRKAKSYVLQSQGLKTVNLDPVSGYNHEEHLSGASRVKTRLVDVGRR